jgi:hypothetical protein
MSWLEVFLLFIGFLFAMALLGVVAAIAGLLIAASRAEKRERAKRGRPAPADEVGADILPDGSPAVQRSRLWPPSCRLREDYIEAAESAYDWSAAESAPTRKPVR